MTNFTNEAEAIAAGFTLSHDAGTQRFLLHAGDRVIGEAGYQLLPGNVVNFHHTVVHPEFRGTGLSGVLAHYALTSELANVHTVQAGCWFMAQYLGQHPELLTKR